MKWTVGVILGAVIVLGLFITFSGKSSSVNLTASSATGNSYVIDRISADLGKMKVNDEKSAIFKLTNTDSEPINLRNFNTSCNCTDAIVKIGTKISPRFNMMMHMSVTDAAWNADLAPGETAEIELIYMPAKMPVYGAVQRYLNFEAGGKKQKLTINAIVE